MKVIIHHLFSNKFSHFEMVFMALGAMAIIAGEPPSLVNFSIWMLWCLIIGVVTSAVRHFWKVTP